MSGDRLGRRIPIRLAAAVGCMGLVSAGAAPGAGSARPVQVSAPTSISLLGPQVAASATGSAAVSYNEVNLDAQSTASSFLALAPPHGAFGAARPIPGAQEVLAIAYSGSALELLTASGLPGQPCCATVEVIRRGAGGGFGHRQTLVTNVGGGATGQLVPLANGRTLAVIAGPQRLWAAEGSSAGHFGAVHGLTPPGAAPAAVAAVGTAAGGSTVAWSRGSAATISAATAGPGATPSRPRTLVTLAPGHAIDGLQLAARPNAVTVAWTESWSDAAGYHAEARAADVGAGGVHPRGLSAPGEVASGLSLTSDARGAEVAAWDVCALASGTCVIDSRVRAGVAVRRRHGPAAWFGPVSHLGPIDPGASPEVAMSPAGRSLLGWITGGRVALASKPAAASRFGPARRVSGALAENLELGYGPTGRSVTAWTEGTAAPAVFVLVGR